MRLLLLLTLAVILTIRCTAADVSAVVTALMSEETELKGVPFSEVVRAATGRQVLPLRLTNAVDQDLVARISRAMDAVVEKFNATNSPAHSKRRINEVSALFESAMKAELNVMPGFECDFPKTAAGVRQRSGYPDLRLVDRNSGRVLYLDPKLFESRGRASSLRTFYYEPKRATNKILEDAHHLIVGFEHDGKTGAWRFMGWELVDLAHFRVQLKAEFQASNRDLYSPEALIARSGTNSAIRPKQRLD